jgi:amidase
MQFSAWSDGSPVFNEFFESMNHPTDERWKQVSDKRAALTSDWQEYFKKYDFFVVPISYGEAFKKCATGSKINDDGNEVSYGFYVPYTGIFNVTGHPSIAIPLGLNKNGMPIGVQIVGPLYSEPELLHLAKLLKPITPGFTKPKS